MAQQRQAVFAAGGIAAAGILACVLLLASTPRTPTTLLGVMPQPYRYPKVFVANIWNSAPQEISCWNPVSERTLQSGVVPDPPATGWEKDTLSLCLPHLSTSSTPPHAHPTQPTPTPSPSRRRGCIQPLTCLALSPRLCLSTLTPHPSPSPTNPKSLSPLNPTP